METITVPTKEQVGPVSRLLFDHIQRRIGKVPNLYATIGYSANALKGFLEFEDTLSHGTFTAKEREAIALVVSEVNGCNYCLAAHTLAATKRGFSNDETLSIRAGMVNDARLNAIIQLARSIAENKGKADQTLVAHFFDAGHDHAALMELVALVALRAFTNYVFALTDVPIDFPLATPLNLVS